MTQANTDKQAPEVVEQPKDHTLATIGVTEIVVPANMREFVDKNGNVMQAKAYIQTKAGLPISVGKGSVSITELVKSLGDKGKAWKKAFNAARPIIAKAHAKAWAIAGADPTMRKSVKFVFGSKGNFLGIDGKARFTQSAVDVDALVEANAALTAQLAAALARLPAPVKA